MSTKPETQFYRSVHDHLPKKLHREKMSNLYYSGTADVWYSGQLADLWVEYKFIRIPARPDTQIKLDLSPLQLKWLRERKEEGRNVWVIVGSKTGGVIYKGLSWEASVSAFTFRSLMVDRKEIARQIAEFTYG